MKRTSARLAAAPTTTQPPAVKASTNRATKRVRLPSKTAQFDGDATIVPKEEDDDDDDRTICSTSRHKIDAPPPSLDHLSTLPHELVSAILSFLSHDLASLTAFALASSSLAPLAHQQLYRHLVVVSRTGARMLL
jgi:hypothetical protein